MKKLANAAITFPAEPRPSLMTSRISSASKSVNSDKFPQPTRAIHTSGLASVDTRVENQNTNSLRSGLGARIASTCRITPKFALIPEIRAEWQHEFLGYAPVLQATLGVRF